MSLSSDTPTVGRAQFARLATDPPGSAYLKRGFRRRDLPTPAGRMTVYENGTGRPLVFLHGIGGGASSWAWNRIAPDFVRDHYVVVLDWVGWGYSEHPKRPILFDDYVGSLETLLCDLGEPATVVAQSLSCGFAAALAERRPDLIARFIFATPSGGKDFGGDAFGLLARLTITSFASLPLVDRAFYKALFHRRAFIGGWLRQEGFHEPEAVTGEIVDGFLYSARQPNAAFAALPFATGELRYDFAPYLARIAVPTSIYWGERETQVGRAVRERLGALRRDIPLTLIADTKACPELERPGDVGEVIAAALQSSSTSAR